MASNAPATPTAIPGATSLPTSRSQEAVGRYFRRLFSGEVVNKALRFAAAAVLAHGLSASEFGIVNVGIAVAGIAATLGSLGLAEVGARELAQDPARVRQLAGQVLVARFLAFLVLAALGALVAAIWYPNETFALAVGAMTLALLATGEWVARGLEEMGTVARSTAAGGATALLAACLVAVAAPTVTAALIGFVAAEIVATCSYWRAARGRLPRLQLEGVRALVTRASPVAISVVALYTFYANLDTIILASARSAAEAGYYSAAYRLFLALNIVAVFVAYANYPILSRVGGVEDVRYVIELLAPSLWLVASYGGIVVGIVALAGDDMLRLFFGDQFGAAGTAFLLLTVSTAWYCVGYVVGYNLVATGHAPRFTVGASIAGVVSVVLGLLLIPPYGMEGAGAATAVAIVLATLVWFGWGGLGARSVRLPWSLVGVLSVAGVVGVVWPELRVMCGVVSLLGALIVAVLRLAPSRSSTP
jgi:O-antigen/teichoic acid export membrane protein